MFYCLYCRFIYYLAQVLLLYKTMNANKNRNKGYYRMDEILS